MDNPYSFNLLTIAGIISRRKKFILFIALAAGLAGILGAAIRPKTYDAKAEFFLKNPFYTDRNFLYNDKDARLLDYFAAEEDMNHLVVLVRSDTVQNQLIHEMHLATAYHVDTTNAKEVYAFKKKFSARLNLWRTDNRSVEIGYTDKDPKTAADVTNRAITLIEQSLQRFYTETRAAMYQSVLQKITEEGRIINSLTDSLVRLREQYGIYDIISPTRQNLVLGSMKNSGKPGFAMGVEQVQNIEAMKDELVNVRAHNFSIAQLYANESAPKEMPLIFLVKTADPPVRTQLLDVSAGIIGFLCGLFFSSLFVLITSYYSNVATNSKIA